METARYVVALIAVVVYPPVLCYWLLVHPLTRFWRWIGLAASYPIVAVILVGICAGMYLLREPILAVEFGTNWLLIGLAAILLVAGMAIEVRCRKQLAVSTLFGVPQLKPEGSPRKLLKEGIYGRIRHPRYAGATFGLLATALFVNYFAIHVLALVYFPIMYIITVLEEKELLDRFGEGYREYRRNVPRFIPRRRRRT